MPSVTPISGSTPATPSPQAQVQGDAVQAQVTKLPPSLETVDRNLTLRGEVQAVNEDGTVRISTPRGPVDVKLPDPQPTRGQQVEVQIPAGNPPRTATVTVQQQQPAPQPLPQQPTPPPLPPTTSQPTPLPQTPTPATPPQGQAPTPPAQSIPTPTTQTPLPPTGTPSQPPIQNTPAQNTPAPNTPAQQTPAQPAQTQAPQVSPQGLLNFLKESLQTILKSPTAQNTAANTPDAPARPIQPGQLVRLTPLPANQTPQALPQTAITKAILPLPQSAASIAVQITAAQKPIAMPALLLQPGTPTPTQTLLNPAIQISGTQTPAAPDVIARILMPMLNASAPPAPMPGTSILQNALPTLMTALQTPDTIPTPHQPALVVPSTPHTPILPQATDVRVVAILPNMATPMLQNASTSTLLNGTPTAPSLFAQVAGQTPQGLPVIALPTFTQQPDGTQKPANLLMALQFPTRALAPNAILRLDVLQQPMSLANPASASTLSSAITWDTLDDILQNKSTQPQAQAQMQAIIAGIPKPGGAVFTAPVLMLLSALRSGDITSWMGDKGIDAIKMSRRTDALSKILSDFTNNTRSMDDRAPVSEWRSTTLPMLYGQELSRINLYYRSFERDGDEQGSSEKQKGTRFIMDLSLTRMGPLQIDGFSVGKKLDVTLRSEQTLSPGMREAMRTRYSDAITGIGFAGNLHFSNDLEHKGWVTFENQATRESKFI